MESVVPVPAKYTLVRGRELPYSIGKYHNILGSICDQPFVDKKSIANKLGISEGNVRNRLYGLNGVESGMIPETYHYLHFSGAENLHTCFVLLLQEGVICQIPVGSTLKDTPPVTNIRFKLIINKDVDAALIPNYPCDGNMGLRNLIDGVLTGQSVTKTAENHERSRNTATSLINNYTNAFCNRFGVWPSSVATIVSTGLTHGVFLQIEKN